MKKKNHLNKFLNRNPFFYKVRNVLLFRNITEAQLSKINYNNYNPKESIPKIYKDTNALIFENQNLSTLNDFDKAIQIARWLCQHIKGGKGLGTNSIDALKLMLKGGFGVCSDFSQIFNNFCVINDIKVREWGLKKIGSHIDGHSFNEFYAKEQKQWVCIDVSKSIYFINKSDTQQKPLSTHEFFSITNKEDLSYKSFNPQYKVDDKKIHKFFFSNLYFPFVIDKYVNERYDRYLKKYQNLPIPIIHGFLILINQSYNYNKVEQKKISINSKPKLKSRIRTLILKFLNILPARLGYYIYHSLQRFTLKKTENYIKTNTTSIKLIESILKENNFEIKGKDIIEIGSGWFPIMPYLFKSHLGANTIFTYDINKHYNTKRILDCNKLFSKELKTPPNDQLPDFVQYYPNTSIDKSNFEFNPQLVYSRFVLEHISPEELLSIHQHLYNETPKDTKILHLISPSDHRSYDDAHYSSYDFLKYSKEEWDNIQTKFDYHNRLRLPEYLDIFKKANYKIEYLKYQSIDKNSLKYKKFKEIVLHHDFNKFTEEEILASSIIVLLSK